VKGKIVLTLVLGILVVTTLSFGPQEARVLRFPAVSNDQIAFSYAGDLYTVPLAGGVARKLTAFYEGYEAFPRFSPDGRSVAFTGEYDGNREVYLIPADGGTPKRLTYTPSLSRDDIADRMGPNNLVMNWTPDGKRVVFRSRMREWNDFNGQLYLVPAEGGMPEELPLPRGGFCSYSPDGTKLAYNRIFREFRTWKRYRGGMADDVWIYDFATKKTEDITNNPAQDIIPMWSGNRIYFLSDRDENKRMNLYVYDLGTRETRQLTRFVDFDIKFPSLGPKHIVFENGGYLYTFELATEKLEKVPVIVADDQVMSRTRVIKTGNQIWSFEIAPDGKRALFAAHGELYTVPAEHGNVRNLTGTPGVNERNPKWSPDGKTIAFISDKSGTEEIWTMNQDGTGTPVQITTNGDTYKYQLLWSPDGKKIMWNDKMLRLSYVDVATKEIVVVATAQAGEITDFVWSPDSRWVSYGFPEPRNVNRVFLFSAETKKAVPVTDSWYESGGPSFSNDGKYLFFVSDRDFQPIYSHTEWNHAYLSMSGLYFVTLAKDVKSPFAPKSDEVSVKAAAEEKSGPPAKPAKPAAKPAEKKETPSPVKVDLDGIMDRIVGLPVERANYGGINVVGDSVYYLRLKDLERAPSLMLYDLSALKEKELGKINGYEISADTKKMIVAKDRAFSIIDLPKGPVNPESTLDLGGMETVQNLRQEWDQIYEECWRQMKEFFYAPNMNGVDWDALRLRYKPLAEAVSHRADLTYVIGELIGELSSGHTYVGGGDVPRPKKLSVGMLGAQFERDAKTGYFRIAKILKGENWDRSTRSPLTELGVNVKEGEYLVAIDGKPCDKMADLYEALYGTVGRQVTLKVNGAPAEKGSREVVVIPVETENSLYYYNWVEDNIEKVTKATDGKVGYIHIPNMGVEGLNEFVKHFYPQLRKQALIIDVRGNGGGNVSPMIIDRLVREMVMIEMGRNEIGQPDPGAAFVGPKVCLCDEFSASDGDIFPYRFKYLKLGKLIGKRTWGGVVGIRGSLPLLDGGFLNKPEFAPYSVDGKKWIIEGEGVTPDITVDNDPAQEFAGVDEQLNKAIEVILEELKTQGWKLPPHPPFPIKK
jgi:tricorn protease